MKRTTEEKKMGHANNESNTRRTQHSKTTLKNARLHASSILRYVYTVYKYGSCRDRSRSFAPHPGGSVASDEDLKLNQERQIVFRDEHQHDHVCDAAVLIVLYIFI